MTKADKLKLKIEAMNPIAIARRTLMRKRLRNRTVSFLTPNCIGGILFHDLGLKFRSPTVNLMMNQKDFIKFASQLYYYLGEELEFFSHPDYKCPCAHLGDISIHFTHYTSEAEARKKWQERTQRLDASNLFIFAQERDGVTKEEIRQLGKVNAKGIVVFTAHLYDDIPHALYIPKYAAQGEVGNVLKRNYLTDAREYEKYFDFVKWFNEADGMEFDCRRYSKI